MSGTATTLKTESNFTRREKNHSLFHWRHWRLQNYSYEFGCQAREAASTIIGTWMALETCLILGQVSHNLLYSKKKLLTDICGLGEINEKTAYIQARSSMARALEINGKACQAEGKAKVVWGKAPSWKRTKIAWDLFHRPWGYGFKETIKNARKKLETSVAPAMPCKIMKNCGSGASNKIQTKLACILEADESTRVRMGNSIPHHHEDHIAGKGEKSLQHYNLVHKFIPMPQAMKIPAAKAAVDKEWEKLEKISAWNLTKVRSKKEVIDVARTKGAKVHFASLMDTCHLKNAELEAKHQKYKGRVVLRGDIVKDDSGSYAVFHWTRIVSITNEGSKNHGYHLQITRLQWTSNRRSISLYPSENGRCSKIIENSKIGMSRHLHSSTTTQMA